MCTAQLWFLSLISGDIQLDRDIVVYKLQSDVIRAGGTVLTKYQHLQLAMSIDTMQLPMAMEAATSSGNKSHKSAIDTDPFQPFPPIEST